MKGNSDSKIRLNLRHPNPALAQKWRPGLWKPYHGQALSKQQQAGRDNSMQLWFYQICI